MVLQMLIEIVPAQPAGDDFEPLKDRHTARRAGGRVCITLGDRRSGGAAKDIIDISLP